MLLKPPTAGLAELSAEPLLWPSTQGLGFRAGDTGTLRRLCLGQRGEHVGPAQMLRCAVTSPALNVHPNTSRLPPRASSDCFTSLVCFAHVSESITSNLCGQVTPFRQSFPASEVSAGHNERVEASFLPSASRKELGSVHLNFNNGLFLTRPLSVCSLPAH